MKRCFKCGVLKPRTEFYRARGMLDGLSGKCKACTTADVAANRQTNLARIQAYDRKRGREKLDSGWRSTAATSPESAQKSIAKRKASGAHQANSAVTVALRSGKLVPQPCERCGSTEHVHAHHEDYSKPLEVMWLCRRCHGQRHREMKDANI